MNSKTFKKIRKKTNAILFEWLQTLVSEEEFKKITTSNIDTYLPKLEYVVNLKTYMLGMFSKRWTYQTLKKMIKDGHDINKINYEYFNTHYKGYIYGGS